MITLRRLNSRYSQMTKFAIAIGGNDYSQTTKFAIMIGKNGYSQTTKFAILLGKNGYSQTTNFAFARNLFPASCGGVVNPHYIL